MKFWNSNFSVFEQKVYVPLVVVDHIYGLSKLLIVWYKAKLIFNIPKIFSKIFC